MKQLITKTTLISFAGILLTLGVTTMHSSNHDLEQFIEGLVEVLLAIALITIREYYKTIPDNGNGNNKTDTAIVKETHNG